MITIIDTATTGIPLWGSHLGAEGQPRAIQIAAIEFDRDRRIMNSFSVFLKRDGWVSSQGARAAHHIPEGRCDRYGVDAVGPLKMLVDMVATSKIVTSYGILFDRTMVEIEMFALAKAQKQDLSAFRFPAAWIALGRRWLCLSDESAAAANGGKRMKLPEAHQALTGALYEQRHDAQEDRDAAARILWALVDAGKVEV